MKLLSLSADDIRAALPMREAVEAMKLAFAAVSTGDASAPPRTAIQSAAGITLLMGAGLPDPARGLVAKIVSIFPGNPSRSRPLPTVGGLAVILDPDTGHPTALCDGTFLTAWRTGAASGAATDLLAKRGARHAAVIGLGAQARTQVLGIDAVRTLATIRVHGRDGARVRAFIDELQPRTQASLQPALTVEAALEGCEVLCTATNSTTPLFAGEQLPAGIHINAVGAFTPAMCEVDAAAVSRAAVFVDSLEAAGDEAGDLIQAAREGVTDAGQWTELGQVTSGHVRGRESDEQVTLFKSVGLAVQDVAAASRALTVARARGLGREITL